MKKIYLITFIFGLLCVSQKAVSLETGKTPADGSGFTYNYVKIGNQYWMSENLKTTKFLNGEDILNATEYTTGTKGTWFLLLDKVGGLGLGSPAYSLHTDENYVQAVDGLYYNWFAAVDSRGICPTGWRVPSDNDLKILETSLGMKTEELDVLGYRGETEAIGSKLKSADRGFGGNNETGFNLLPSGYRSAQGYFLLSTNTFFNEEAYIFSTDTNPLDASVINQAFARHLENTTNGIERVSLAKPAGSSIRCVKDATTAIDDVNSSAKAVSTKIYSLSGLPIYDSFESLPKGIYFKEITYDNGKTVVEKVVKNTL